MPTRLGNRFQSVHDGYNQTRAIGGRGGDEVHDGGLGEVVAVHKEKGLVVSPVDTVGNLG